MKNSYLIASAFFLSASVTVNAGIIAPLNDGAWSVLVEEDQNSSYLNPGCGGQLFDAEYLLYKFDESTGDLSFDGYEGIHQTNGTDYHSYAYSTTFNLASLGVSYDITQLDAHWTMSCGNDVIEGSGEIPPVSVPEPSSWMLMSTGLLALFGGLIARRRREVL